MWQITATKKKNVSNAGSHLTKNCSEKGRTEHPKCANCNGDHTASFPECEIYKKVYNQRNKYAQKRNMRDAPRVERASTNQHSAPVNNPTDRRSYRDVTTNKTSRPSKPAEAENENIGIAEIIKELISNFDLCKILQL